MGQKDCAILFKDVNKKDMNNIKLQLVNLDAPCQPLLDKIGSKLKSLTVFQTKLKDK